MFHVWCQDFTEIYESGPGHFPAAVVESQDEIDFGAIHVVDARLVSFGAEPKFS